MKFIEPIHAPQRMNTSCYGPSVHVSVFMCLGRYRRIAWWLKVSRIQDQSRYRDIFYCPLMEICLGLKHLHNINIRNINVRTGTKHINTTAYCSTPFFKLMA